MDITVPEFDTAREALDLFWGGSVRKMADDLGLTVGAIYNSWLTKEAGLPLAMRDRVIGCVVRKGLMRLSLQIKAPGAEKEFAPADPVPVPYRPVPFNFLMECGDA